jgi:cation:H+ antiporter
MIGACFAVVFGLVVLTYGADRFVVGAAATARNLGVSTLIIGLTVVGFATSAPEMITAADAAWAGNPAISIGNALGSNIANMGLVLGLTALLRPLQLHSRILKREYPIMFAAMGVALVLMSDGALGRVDGAILALGMVATMLTTVWLGTRSRPADPLVREFEQVAPVPMSTLRSTLLIMLGLIVMLGGAHLLVWGGVQIATLLGVSELVVGLTIVAVGTSLPELAASLMSGFKGEPEIAIGNVIGSNMFNMLGVLCLPGLIDPGEFPGEVLTRDFPTMIGLSFLMFVTSFGFRGPGQINRYEGLMLFCAFCAYQWFLCLSPTGKVA